MSHRTGSRIAFPRCPLCLGCSLTCQNGGPHGSNRGADKIINEVPHRHPCAREHRFSAQDLRVNRNELGLRGQMLPAMGLVGKTQQRQRQIRQDTSLRRQVRDPRAALHAGIRAWHWSSKSEIRSPKQIRISNDPRLQTPHQGTGFGHLCLGALGLFRVSDFGFMPEPDGCICTMRSISTPGQEALCWRS